MDFTQDEAERELAGLTRNILGDPNLLEAHGLEMPLSLKIGRAP